MAEKEVIITIPHGGCKYNEVVPDNCDKAAFNIGSILKCNFEENKIIPYFYANTDIPKSVYDMNLSTSRGTHFRTSLTQLLRFLHDKQVCLFDIHSFKAKGKYPIYLMTLNTPEAVKKSISLASLLSATLGFKVGLYLIGQEEDIIIESSDIISGCYSVMVVVNEDVNKVILNEMCRRIVEWVKDP